MITQPFLWTEGLLRHGADPDATTTKGVTPYQSAWLVSLMLAAVRTVYTRLDGFKFSNYGMGGPKQGKVLALPATNPLFDMEPIDLDSESFDGQGFVTAPALDGASSVTSSGDSAGPQMTWRASVCVAGEMSARVPVMMEILTEGNGHHMTGRSGRGKDEWLVACMLHDARQIIVLKTLCIH